MKLDEQTICAHLKIFYGYEPKNESLLIKHLMYEAETLIKNFCHVKTIPEGAVHPAIDYVCGRYLKHKIDTGTLVDEDGEPLYEFESPESSVKIGDVSISYASGYGMYEGDNAFLGLVNDLADENHFKHELSHFRKIKWKP